MKVQNDARTEIGAEAMGTARVTAESPDVWMDIETTPHPQHIYSVQGSSAVNQVPIVSPQSLRLRYHSQPSIVNQWSKHIQPPPFSSTLDMCPPSVISWQGLSPIPPSHLSAASPTNTQFSWTTNGSSGFGYSASNPPGSHIGTPSKPILHAAKQRRTITGKYDLTQQYEVNDTMVEKKTTENLLQQTLQVLDVLKNKWGVIVKYLNLVTPDCYCHQINLIVGDYFKMQNTTFLMYASQANDLIAWLQSKTAVIGLIKAALIANGKQPLSIIFIIMDAQKPTQEQQVIPEKDRKAQKMVHIARDPVFWQSLVCQSYPGITPSSRSGPGWLYMEYHKLSDAEDAPVHDSLFKSIKQCWEKADQDVFIAAIFLNPFLKSSPFQKNLRLISTGSIHTLLSRLWLHFYSTPVPTELYEEIIDNKEVYADLENACTTLKATANETPDPVCAYQDIMVPGVKPTPLIHLTLHILSICPNSASCKC
ncbi:hypothetical protein CPB84DRAFT_1850999 [Gymnopilus junonius]|uniref:Uncharacterized protein n=1 Tax=Gymnopilus junonius TaxID=109634 RepID=A0A9P5NHA4_GYMJU|nr:hypothetical protein CPB84DRAFT_1850999 [Gymnopilus junonius]